MALFIGRIPRSMNTHDLEDIFAKYGKITRLDVKTDFGFVEYEDKLNAEEALKEVNGQQDLVVEWAKNNGRRSNENECFNCGKEGHWAKDCREKPREGGRYGRSRARSPRRDYGGRDRRGGDRDYDRRDRRDNRDRSPRRDDHRNGDGEYGHRDRRDRNDRGDRGDRSDRSNRGDRGDRGDRSDRNDRGGRREDRERSPDRERRARE